MCPKSKRRSWKVVLMLVMVMVALLLIACGCWLWEPRAPQRSFTLEDLFVERGAMPSGWVAHRPFLPAGDDLCTTECTAVRFGVAGREPPIQAEQDVFRYLSTGIAQRTFTKVYLKKVAFLEPVSEWVYQSSIADQEHFGCYEWAGPAGLVCEWAGQYEEYIVVLRCRMVPNEMSLEDMERVVRAIDARIAEYLGKPLESGD